MQDLHKGYGKEKLLAPKFDYICKRVGRKKITSPMFSVPKRKFSYAKDCQHVKNKVFYVSKNDESALDKVMQGVAHEGLKEVLQFLYVFLKGKPMHEYKSMKCLL
jgi:hypothetical protein